MKMSQQKSHNPESKNLEKKQEGIEAVLESSNELQNLTEGIDSSVMEKVSEISGENKPATPVSGKKNSSFFDISSIANRIKNLIPQNNTPKKIILPKKEIQVKLVEKSLKAKQKKLLAQADKVVQSKKFSAAKLEKIINQIRYIQSILEELINAATKTIEKLYKKFVLKTG